MKVSQRSNLSETNKGLNELELELVKMTDVSRDIRIVLDNILVSEDFDKTVSASIMHEFQNELCMILSKMRQLPLKDGTMGETTSHTHIKLQDDRIQRHNEQQENFQIKFKKRYANNLNDLYDINQHLSQQNELTSKKLQQAEQYIKKLEMQNSLLINSMNTRGETKEPRRSEMSYSNEANYGCYSPEVQQLKADLKEAEDFISRNNEEFVKQLQKYNEKIWKLQRDLDETRNRLYVNQSAAHDQDIVICKLRQENFNLQVLTRNMRGYISQQDRYAFKDTSYTPISQQTDRTHKQSKLKEYFQQKIQETLKRRKQSDS